MSLRIRILDLLVVTEGGNFGATIEFDDGLNVLRAPNTSGKSTAMMSILYGLGLEGMLGPSHQPPLPDAMRTSIMSGREEVPVVESWVRMEIENHRQERVAIQRQVEGGQPNSRQLIRAILGPGFSSPSKSYKRRDFYVRIGGAAQEASGFHRFLAEFMGYSLPQVPATDSESIPLYLECLFPFFFVDQLTGWRDVKARMPTYLRVPEMAKRSVEFILQLDILQRAIEKQQAEQQQAAAKERWARLLRDAKTVASTHDVMIRGIPDEPCATWPPSPSPELLVTDGTDWSQVDDEIENLDARLAKLQEEEIPRAEQVSQESIRNLQSAEEELSRLTSRLETRSRDLEMERANHDAVMSRLRALLEDYRKYQDAKKVEDRGGTVSLQMATGQCPTCHQAVEDVLLDQRHAHAPMTIEQNIAFIRDQVATFRDMLEDTGAVVEAKERQVRAIENKIGNVSSRIRALKRTLHSDGRVPSTAAIQEQFQVEERAKDLRQAKTDFKSFDSRFAESAKEWIAILSKLKSLANIGLSEMDDKKVRYLSERFVEQLNAYEFSSFTTAQMAVSRESYRPSRNEHDVGLTSASDTIRIIWAYLLALLETDRKFQTNHAGLLVFDEPRQQGTKKLSFDALLRRAAMSRKGGQQVICATSEDKDTLDAILEGVPCKYIQYDSKILKKLPTRRPEK